MKEYIIPTALTVITLLILWFRWARPFASKKKKKNVTPQQSDAQQNSTVPSVYTVRANRLFLARRRIIPRLFMWGLIVMMVAFALYLFNPHVFSYTLKEVGPSIGIALMGFAVLGIGQSMEETHESYEFSRLGWGGAFVLWIIALVTLFR